MKRIDIEKQASEIVRAYMDKGYHLTDCPNYIGDDERWDVTNRKERIEIVICYQRIDDKYPGCSLIVYRSGDLGGESRNKREMISIQKYYWIGGDWYGTKDEADQANLVREKKLDIECKVAYYSHLHKTEALNSAAAKKILLPYIREHCWRCKSIRLSDIGAIKHDSAYGGKGFGVQVKKEWQFFPFARKRLGWR